MTAITLRAPTGFAGGISRTDSLTVQQEIVDTGTPPTLYGGVVKLVSGKLQPLASGDTVATVIATGGILVRPFPVQSVTNTFGNATPPASGLADVLKRGYICVPLKIGTAAKMGQVYVVKTAGGSVVVGDYVTSTSPAGGGTAEAVTGAFFMGPADAGGIVEIAYRI